jgi:hypothetical protein
MRKALSIIAILFAAMIAQVAHASPTYVYTYSLTATGNYGTYNLTWTTDPMAAVTGSTYIAAADLASYSVTGTAWTANGYALAGVVLDDGGNGFQSSSFTNASAFQPAFLTDIQNLSDGTTIADYSTPGAYPSGPFTYIQWNPVTGGTLSGYPCCSNYNGDSALYGTDNLIVTAVSPTPEPASMALFGTGLLGIGFIMRKRLFAFGQEHAPKA